MAIHKKYKVSLEVVFSYGDRLQESCIPVSFFKIGDWLIFEIRKELCCTVGIPAIIATGINYQIAGIILLD